MTDGQQRISEVTRRAIFDRIVLDKLPWSGRLEEPDFLARLYNLNEMGSTDHRFGDAHGDIWQHRVRNWDWEPDWVFTDQRFGLLHCSDEELLRFLCETLHPVVQADGDVVAHMLEIYNAELRNDGFQIVEKTRISGRPVFAARETEGQAPPAAKERGVALRDLPVSLPREPIPAGAYGRTASGEKYELLDLLGEGAVGHVYSCRRIDSISQEKYAMKILSPLQHIVKSERGYERLCMRFVQESTRSQHMTHPGLVEILDHGRILHGEDMGPPFCLMSFVKGQALNTLFSQPAPPLWHRLGWAIELGRVLGFMHEKGVLHRDVKPANIMIESESARVFLSDFGVVQWGDLASEYTDGIETYSSEILTTWNYLPPEVEMRPKAYDVVAETWSYGKTIAEIFAWRQIARGSLLTGLFNLKDYLVGQFLAEVTQSLLEPEPRNRSSVESALEIVTWYESLWKQTRGLGPENYQSARESVSGLRTADHGGKSMDKFLTLLQEQGVPEMASLGAKIRSARCPRCDSQCIVMYKRDEYVDGDYSSHYVCLGHPSSPCGHVWEVYFKEDGHP